MCHKAIVDCTTVLCYSQEYITMEKLLAKEGEGSYLVRLVFIYVYLFVEPIFEHPLCIRHYIGHLGHWLIKQRFLPLKSLPEVGGR